MNERIKKLRRSLDLTQQEFADRIGVKRNTIANYEIGRNAPIDSVLSLIVREFNVNEKWLRTGEGEMFIPSPTSELDALTVRYPQMTHETYVFIEKLVNLPEASQNVIMGFLREVVQGFGDATPGASANPRAASEKTKEELQAIVGEQCDAESDIASAEALYEKNLGFAPSVGYTASNTTGVTGSDDKAAGNE